MSAMIHLMNLWSFMKRFFLLVLLCTFSLSGIAQIEVRIDGVKGQLLQNIRTRMKELAGSTALSNSDAKLQQQVAQALYPYGYFLPYVSINRSEKSLRITVRPGVPATITQLNVRLTGAGSSNKRLTDMLADLPIRQGTPFNSLDYQNAKQDLLNAAAKEGYVHASFDKAEILINKKENSVKINLIFNSGDSFYFGQVRFDPTYLSPELLHRYLPFQYGQTYSAKKLLAFNNALSGSGYFSSVSVQPNLGDKQTYVPIDVHLQPASRYSYSLGLGYGTDTGPRGRADFHMIPVNRSGHKFNAIALGSLSENRVQAQYVIPGENPLTDQYNVTGSFSTLNYNVGYSNSMLLSVGKRRDLKHFQAAFSMNGLYERFNYEGQPHNETLAFFPKGSLTLMQKSSPLFSPSGYNISLNALAANRQLLSDISFTQLSIDAKVAWMIEPIRTRLYAHGIQGYTGIGNIYQLPLSLAPLLGGTDNMKGYSFNSIGPGKKLSYAGLEVQKEIKENWYLTGFFDTGTVYDPDPRKLLYDAGLGLMWVSPVGPIKIGVAQAINERFDRFEKRGPKLVISMGPDL